MGGLNPSPSSYFDQAFVANNEVLVLISSSSAPMVGNDVLW